MSEIIELNVHTQEGVEPKQVKIASNATVNDLINAIQTAGAVIGEPGDEIILWVENEEVPCDNKRQIHEHGIKHGHHVHCHRCKHVHVTVAHGAKTVEKSFAPSATFKKVHEWAVKELNLPGATLYLHGDFKTKLPDRAHIGSYAKSPGCKLALCLACDEIRVDVAYTGHNNFEGKFPSETALGVVKLKAMSEFSLEQSAASKYALQHDGANFDDNVKLIVFGKCELSLTLVLKQPQEKGYVG